MEEGCGASGAKSSNSFQGTILCFIWNLWISTYWFRLLWNMVLAKATHMELRLVHRPQFDTVFSGTLNHENGMLTTWMLKSNEDIIINKLEYWIKTRSGAGRVCHGMTSIPFQIIDDEANCIIRFIQLWEVSLSWPQFLTLGIVLSASPVSCS